MIKRLRVFGENEKEKAVESLIKLHFFDYKKYFDKFYMNDRGGFIFVNVNNDLFRYNKNVPEKKVLNFKVDYEKTIAKELKTNRIGNLEKLIDPNIIE